MGLRIRQTLIKLELTQQPQITQTIKTTQVQILRVIKIIVQQGITNRVMAQEAIHPLVGVSPIMLLIQVEILIKLPIHLRISRKIVEMRIHRRL